MIVDSSALIAILRQEADADRYAEAINAARYKAIGTPNFVETCMVFANVKGDDAIDIIESLVRQTGVEILSFTPAAARIAADAFLKYGKGRHKAALNFGDCIAYGLAKSEAMPLLFKGDDFRLTDIQSAL